MPKPESYGQVRIIEFAGNEHKASIGGLSGVLSLAQETQTPIVEISSPLGGFYDNPERKIQTLCPTNPTCPVTLNLSFSGVVSAGTRNASPIPPECLQCAGQRVIIAAGLIPQLNNDSPVGIGSDS